MEVVSAYKNRQEVCDAMTCSLIIFMGRCTSGYGVGSLSMQSLCRSYGVNSVQKYKSCITFELALSTFEYFFNAANLVSGVIIA